MAIDKKKGAGPQQHVKDMQIQALANVNEFLGSVDMDNPNLTGAIWERINDVNVQTIISEGESHEYSENWSQEMVGKLQRSLVNYQLRHLYAGNAIPVFSKLKEVLHILDKECSRSLLDIGCTSGYYYEVINFYCPHTFEYVGCDYNKESIKLATEYYPGVDFQVGDVTNLSFDDQEFDVSFLSGVIEHVPEYEKALEEVCRVSGRYIILHRIWLDSGPTSCKQGTQYFVPVIRNQYNKEEFFRILEENSFMPTWTSDVYDGNCRTYILERVERVENSKKKK